MDSGKVKMLTYGVAALAGAAIAYKHFNKSSCCASKGEATCPVKAEAKKGGCCKAKAQCPMKGANECKKPEVKSVRPDPTSYANFEHIRVNSFKLDLNVDFKTKIISGNVELCTETLADGVTDFILDSSFLNIKRVTREGTPLRFELAEAHKAFGQALHISLPTKLQMKGAKGNIVIQFETTNSCTAVQWLEASQTAGKKHPYLFTQCQAIHARSLFPMQDTPAVKCPYTASITVPAPLVALMSARSVSSAASANDTMTYTFDQPVPIPSYLVALAVGALEKRDIGPRSAVWSEKEMVEKGEYEFAETEKYIAAAESIVGPYVWGRYDILLLPPSFPYGGMENPCLTFVTPTLLAGDRSLDSVVAHEISHSWMGNLVSCHTWEHFWMNEGFCVFLERKIIGALYGDKVANLHAIVGWNSLCDCVKNFGEKHAYTCMQVKLDGVDPDDSFSSVPYEKGFNFLLYLESVVGGPKVMNPFLRAHCERFKYGTVNGEEWKNFFMDYMKDKVASEVLAKIDWEAWYHQPGMPPTPKFDTSLVDAADALANKTVQSQGADCAQYEQEVAKWSCNQVQALLNKMLDLQGADFTAAEAKDAEALKGAKERFAAILKKMGQAYKFNSSKNSEIRFRWYTLCVRAEVDEVFPLAVDFLMEQGRMKFIRPLYRDLFKSVKGKKLAVDTFTKHKAQYHSIAAKMVAQDLQIK